MEILEAKPQKSFWKEGLSLGLTALSAVFILIIALGIYGAISEPANPFGGVAIVMLLILLLFVSPFVLILSIIVPYFRNKISKPKS